MISVLELTVLIFVSFSLTPSFSRATTKTYYMVECWYYIEGWSQYVVNATATPSTGSTVTKQLVFWVSNNV